MSANVRGALFLCIAMACFSINDTLVKVALGSLTLGQIIFLRGMMATAMLVAVFHRSLRLEQLRLMRHPAVVLRTIGELTATFFYLISLIYLTVGFMTSIFQALPLAVTAGAALFFGEPVGWRRWLAVTVGFVGMLIIVRPGLEGFNVWSLATLASVFCSALRDLSTRNVPKQLSTAVLSTVTAFLVAIAGFIAIEPLGGWQPVSAEVLAIVFAAAVFLIAGYHYLIVAMRDGEISFMAPFRYTGLLWATFLGFVVFGDIPDRYTIIGAAIVVGSGLYVIYRERITKRAMAVVKSTSTSVVPDGL